MTAPTYAVGLGPSTMAQGDFNADGAPDLVVGNRDSYDLSVLLANGDGTFQPAVSYSDVGYLSVATADFDGNGTIDIAGANGISGVSVLLGDGDGTFQPVINYEAGAAWAIAVGDVNGDGAPDLVVADGGNVNVLRGNGDGSFQAPASYNVGSDAFAIAPGDFNGDGRLDLAVANSSSNAVSILRGNGDGSFQSPASFAVGLQPWSVAVGDFNGDGRLDFTAANSDSDNVSVRLGRGDGTFQSLVNYAAGFNPRSVTPGDFDGDGDLDLAVANLEQNTVSLLSGTGDGTFQAGSMFVVGSLPQALAVTDLNGDGRLDLAVADSARFGGGLPEVAVLLGNGDGTFVAPRSFAVGLDPAGVSVGDFDEDGRPDLVVANYHGDNVSVLLQRDDGTFRPAVQYEAGSFNKSVAVADFNADGHLDFAVVGTRLDVRLGRGDGTFGPTTFYLVVASHSDGVVATDVNGDGALDLAFTVSDFAVGVMAGNGDGTFQAARYVAAGANPYSLAAGDFNHDGHPDLAVTNLSNSFDPTKVYVLLGNGDGTFRAAVPYGLGNTGRSVAVGDFDGDGNLDLAVSTPPDKVCVFLGNGDGTFRDPTDYPTGLGPRSVAAGDMDGDGILDLVVATGEGYFNTSETVSVLLGRGDGSFLAPANYTGGRGPRAVTIGDLNRDGFPDLALANWESSLATVVLNEGVPVTINQAAGQADPTAGATIRYDVVFGMPVSGFEAADVDLSASTVGGTLVPTVNGSGSTYTVTVTGMSGAGTVVASIPAGAAVIGAGIPTPASTSTDNTVTFDAPPTVTINQAAGQPDPTNAPAVTFDIRFGEPVTGFDATDVSLAGSTAAGNLVVEVTGSGDTYTVTVTGMTGRGVVTATIPAGAATDATGNSSRASTSTDNAVEFRNTGTVGFTRAVYEAAEDGGSGTLTLTIARTGGTDGEVSVRYATSSGTALAGSDFEFSTDVLTWAAGEGGERSFTIPILADTLNEGREVFHVTLNDPVGLPVLGLTTAVVSLAPSDGTVVDAAARRPFARFIDSDGDMATVRLGGRQGTATVYRTDPDGDGRGPVELINLADTLPDPLRPRAVLGITVARAKSSLDGGTIGLGAVAGTGLRAISARRANLTGDGITLTGYLGSLVIGNVTNGAEIATGPAGTPLQRTRINALAIGDGTAIDVAAPISSLTAMSFGAGSARAPGIGTMVVRGNLAADVTVTGVGVDPARPALGRLRVVGTVTGSDLSVAGDVGSVVVGAFRGSRLFAGYAGPDIPDPAGFYRPATVGVFQTTGLFDAFQECRLVATAFKTVVLSSVDAANDGARFGVYADASLGAVRVLSPTPFRYDPERPTPPGLGDFEVKIV